MFKIFKENSSNGRTVVSKEYPTIAAQENFSSSFFRQIPESLSQLPMDKSLSSQPFFILPLRYPTVKVSTHCHKQ
jgi:hypothetical protein